MKIFRRILFFVLIAGFIEIFVEFKIPYAYVGLRDNLVKIDLVSLFGLQIWSIVFLKVEPTLTRIGLVVTIFWVTALLFVNEFAGLFSN